MTDWMGLFPEELRQALEHMGESGYRAGQIFSWFSKGVGFDGMTNLPKSLREKLSQNWVYPAAIIAEELSLDGETVKFLFAFADGNIVEGVLLRYHHGNTLCVSTQVGCRMGCAFCASGLDGRARDITAGEMLAMAALVNAKYAQGDRRGITNIVLMGSGEPLDNYENVVRFIRLVSDSAGMGVSPRNIALSTCGLVEGIERLSKEELPLTLSLSLHAPNDSVRRAIMPVAAKYSVEETVKACRRYAEDTGRRVIVEYILIDSVNDRAEHARELSAILRGWNCHANLIPLNPVAERPELKPPEPASVKAFHDMLTRAGVGATLRRALGGDIQGACGQLRRRYKEETER